MYALLLAVLALIAAFRYVFSSRQTSSLNAQQPIPKKPSAQERIETEAFEYATTVDALSDTINVLVLYATEYGFAREVSRSVAEAFSALTPTDQSGNPISVIPRIVNVLHYPMLDFTKETFVAFICSTTGDGVPPNEATAFREALVKNDLIIPHSCEIAVLALGDRAYPHFCAAGVLFDSLFEKNRMRDRVDIDQEDWPMINDWIASLSDHLTSRASHTVVQSQSDYLSAAIEKYALSMNTSSSRYTRANPYLASIVSKQLLTAPKTGRVDDKEVVRVQIDIANSGITYEAGDSIAVIPKNNIEHVQRLLLAMASNGDEMVKVRDKSELVQFEDALLSMVDIKTVPVELILLLRDKGDQQVEKELADKLLNGHALSEYGKQYVEEREIFDVISDFVSARITVNQLVSTLKPLHARYYSISSTPVLSPDTIAITVDVLRYTSINIEREGVASTFLQDRAVINSSDIPIFISSNPNFRLPKEQKRPVIMIGPGTGIAPFIGFIQERLSSECGENWLFFGCRHEQQDFLYKEHLLQWKETGKITLQTAFSRDGPEKVYVQHRIKECQEQLWRLIDAECAHVYVCGDGSHMAGDVDAALCEVVQECGGRSEQDAKNYLETLSTEKRYQRDVWIS